jgi:POT family proton-dependent oligopeptide transporter
VLTRAKVVTFIATTKYVTEAAAMKSDMENPKAINQTTITGVNDEGFGPSKRHPRGLRTLFLTEMWERFSFYGLRPLLILFMSAAVADHGFGFDRKQASAIVGIYAASVYLASLPGGWIADRLVGLRRAILYGALLISAGHISIGVSSFANAKLPFFLGLMLIVCGTGLLKPNASAIVGELYPEGGMRRDAGFSIFYTGINLGAFAGQLVTGFLGETIGWHWGFAAAGIGMLIGVFIFAIRAKATLGGVGESPSLDSDPSVRHKQQVRARTILVIGIITIASVVVLTATGFVKLDAQVIGYYMTYILVSLAVLYFGYLFTFGGLDSNEKKRLLLIGTLFIFAAVFWSAFEQAPTSLNLFAKDFTNRKFGSFEIPAVWFQSVNSAFVILLAPLFAAMWTRLGRKGLDLSSPAKFSFGLLLAGCGFLVMIPAAQIVVRSGGATKVSALWLVSSYLFQTFGELFLSPVGLSSMTKLSPRRYVGQVMGIWFLAAAVGNLIAGLVGGHVDPEKLNQMPQLLNVTTASLMISGIALALLTIPIRRLMKGVQDEGQPRLDSQTRVSKLDLATSASVAE